MKKPPSATVDKSIRHLSGSVKPEWAGRLALMASDAVAAEIALTPKPGLVDASGSGCNDDMDFDMFMKSADAIAPFWEEQAQCGLNGTTPSDALARLRETGLKMERAMFKATGGVNTHKGLIFLMSLLLYGTGACVHEGITLCAENAAKFAALAADGTVENELEPLSVQIIERKLTHGEGLYIEHGITGIRGEAERGFPSVMRSGLPELELALEAGAPEEAARISALLAIMEVCEDSNVMHRGGFGFWHGEYRRLVKNAAEKFDPCSADYDVIAELERAFMPKRINPGGAADLLCCTIFLHLISKTAD
jgi:triphosphoribosyl-dephospho-CoA synthetase